MCRFFRATNYSHCRKCCLNIKNATIRISKRNFQTCENCITFYITYNCVYLKVDQILTQKPIRTLKLIKISRNIHFNFQCTLKYIEQFFCVTGNKKCTWIIWHRIICIINHALCNMDRRYNFEGRWPQWAFHFIKFFQLFT